MSKATGIMCKTCGDPVPQSGGRGRIKWTCSYGCSVALYPYKPSESFHAKCKRRGVCVTCAQAPSGKGVRCDACQTRAIRAERTRNYGVTVEYVQDMLDGQDNRCVICRMSINWDTMHIDHDNACCAADWRRGVTARQRACGRCVRGLLCPTCNVGLGNYKDNPDLLRAAAAYLDRC